MKARSCQRVDQPLFASQHNLTEGHRREALTQANMIPLSISHGHTIKTSQWALLTNSSQIRTQESGLTTWMSLSHSTIIDQQSSERKHLLTEGQRKESLNLDSTMLQLTSHGPTIISKGRGYLWVRLTSSSQTRTLQLAAMTSTGALLLLSGKTDQQS